MENRITAVSHRLLQRLTLTSKLWLSLLATLLLGLIMVSIAFNSDQRQLSEQQLKTLGTAISQQTASSSAALILAGDELSLSINLQQLAAFIQINGAEVLDRKGNRLAQAGQPSELFIEQAILSEQTVLGRVRIHLNPETNAYRPALPLTRISVVVALLLLLTTALMLARHFNRPLQALLQASEQLCAGRLITPLDQQRHDQFGQIALLLNRRFSKPMTELETASSTAVITTTATETQTDNDVNIDLITPAPALVEQDTPVSAALTTTTPTTAPRLTTAHPTYKMVAPLPSRDDPEITPKTATATPSPAPQVATSDPAEHSYLFYINHHVGGSDTLTTTERERLLGRYRKALKQVARLYKGGFDEDPLGNWYVRFLPLSHDQSHGINALCAAQLFNALYRGINTQAIRSASPALKMKLVLLCGPSNNFDTLAEDALLLSDQIQDNDLITHQALYQINSLQERLLSRAKYRKFDQDTYLISALNADYQTLIDRQAEHFLKQSR